jgi:hypothetical protein
VIRLQYLYFFDGRLFTDIHTTAVIKKAGPNDPALMVLLCTRIEYNGFSS